VESVVGDGADARAGPIGSESEVREQEKRGKQPPVGVEGCEPEKGDGEDSERFKAEQDAYSTVNGRGFLIAIVHSYDGYTS
jgi:hypothetical protein